MKKKALFIALGLLSVWLVAWALASTIREPLVLPLYADELLPGKIQSVAIAPRSDALTFARFARDGGTHVVLVTGYADGDVSGIDLTSILPDTPSDPITLFNTLGYEALEALSGSKVFIPANMLLVPFDGTSVQIAMGINYPDHGEEVAVTQQFLFPKFASASRSTASVAARDYLLDYEIELGFVLLQPLSSGSFPQTMGLVLASDYTDRATLMRGINMLEISSGDGFSRAKSKAGFMPVGNLLVIPKDLESYYKSLKLQLWVNGELRQIAEPQNMAWDIRRMVQETFAREGRFWQVDNQPATLPLKEGVIPERTLLLSGTPDGVIFRPPSARQIFVGVSEFVFTLKWNDPKYVVEPSIREAYANGQYLKPGDEVVMHANGLGVIVNHIVSDDQ